MATRNSEYVRSDGVEFIPVTTMHKMERIADQKGWQFTFNTDRSAVTVNWGEVTHTYYLAPRVS